MFQVEKVEVWISVLSQRDCPELKDNDDFVHDVECSSEDESFEKAKALVVSSCEPE
jgi:hypothetical protein